MTQAQLAQFAELNEFLKGMGFNAKAAKPVKQAKRTKADMLAAKDRSIKATFTKRGIKDVVLMDRADPTKAFNVRPFGRKNEAGELTGWLAEGRIVKKGEKSVRGLFHVTQTREMTQDDVIKA